MLNMESLKQSLQIKPKLDELNDKIESATGAEKKRLKTQKYRLKRDIERYKKGENHSQNKKDN